MAVDKGAIDNSGRHGENDRPQLISRHDSVGSRQRGVLICSSLLRRKLIQRSVGSRQGAVGKEGSNLIIGSQYLNTVTTTSTRQRINTSTLLQ